MNFIELISLYIFFLCLNIQFISAPYPKYYIHNYCGSSKGSVIRLGETGKSSVALLKLKRETYRPNLDCNVTIRAPLNYGIIAYVKKAKLRKYFSHEDLLQVIPDDDYNSTVVLRGNNEEITPQINLVSNPSRGEINVAFKSRNFLISLSGKGFRIVLTVYTPTIDGKCGSNSSLGFSCENNYCVADILACDGINNCINYVDEQSCGISSESTIGVIVFMSTIAVMIILVIGFVCRKKEKRIDMARKISKAYTNSGRRLSTMLNSERIQRRQPIVIERNLNQNRNIERLNSYASLPVINQIKEDEERKLDPNYYVNSEHV